MPPHHRLEILGEVRACDQVVRLNLDPSKPYSPRGEGDLWPGRATYIHEWAHYFQYTTTPAGLLISRWRREAFWELLRVTTGLGDRPLPAVESLRDEPWARAKFSSYYSTLEMIGEIWAPWQINLDKYPPEFERVELTPQGLRVHFPRGTRSLELPLGFQQFSEGFAWMCEQINLHGTALSEPPRSLATLTYTWGYWALDDRLGGIPRNAVAMRCWDVMNLLMLGALYDHSFIEMSTTRNPDLTHQQIVTEFAKKRISLPRFIFQAFFSISRLEQQLGRHPRRPYTAHANFLRELGLPAPDDILAGTLAFSQDLRNRAMRTVDEGHRGFNEHLKAEVELWETSIHNLEVLRGSLNTALGNPYDLHKAFHRPITTHIHEGGHHWYVVVDHEPIPAHERPIHIERSMLRQNGISILEHIVHQIAFSDHLACYGSPEWTQPINECPFAESCMAHRDKQGIEFCKDTDWRARIATIFMLARSPRDKDFSPAMNHRNTKILGLEEAFEDLRTKVLREEGLLG